MAARGQNAKLEITQKILQTFSNSFVYDKEIRIPVQENGETIQIKCVLSCAKTNVENGADIQVPDNATNNVSTQLTKEEKEETENLLKSLNLA